LNPIKKPLPIFRSNENDRKTCYFSCLAKRCGLKQLVHGTQAPGHQNRSLRMLHKHPLGDEEVIELQKLVAVDITIVKLFKRQFDVQSYRFTSSLISTFIGRFHYTRASSGNHTIASFGEQTCYVYCYLVIGVFGRSTGRTKYRDTRAYFCELFKSIDKFCHDFKNLPRVFDFYFLPCFIRK